RSNRAGLSGVRSTGQTLRPLIRIPRKGDPVSHSTTPPSAPVPAERILPGVGFQVVNGYDRDGRFDRQYRVRGTERQARAYAALQYMHPDDPGYDLVLAAYRGQE